MRRSGILASAGVVLALGLLGTAGRAVAASVMRPSRTRQPAAASRSKTRRSWSRSWPLPSPDSGTGGGPSTSAGNTST